MKCMFGNKQAKHVGNAGAGEASVTCANLFGEMQYGMEEVRMMLNEHDRGRIVTMRAGSILTVRLKENPTTGYRWSANMIKGMELISDHYETSGAIGADSVRVFEFRVIKSGSYNIDMKNWREWEGEPSVIDRFDAKIIVK